MMTLSDRTLIDTLKSTCYDEIDGPPRSTPPLNRRTVSDRAITILNDQNEVIESPEYPNLTSTLVYRPRFPNYNSYETRLQSFSRWSPSFVMKPNTLAGAGFFYLGDGDNVNCFFCGGGVKDWEQDDDPWLEHIKWYPTCNFVKLMRGRDFVSNAPIPEIRPADVETNQQCGGSRNMTPGSLDIPPQGDLSYSNGHPLNEAYIQRIIDMGFSPDLVHGIIAQHVRNTGHSYSTYEQLLDVVLERDPARVSPPIIPPICLNQSQLPRMEPVDIPAELPTLNSTSTTNSSVSQISNNSINTLNAEITRLTSSPRSNSSLSQISNVSQNTNEIENIECKICRDNEANVCFIPCGHLVACISCSTELNDCPICRSIVIDKIRVYLS